MFPFLIFVPLYNYCCSNQVVVFMEGVLKAGVHLPMTDGMVFELWRHRARTADRAAAKGMMPLKPEENRWRRASFGIGNPYGTTPNCGVLTCTGIL